MIVAKIALQVILGLIFLFTGTIKITTPKKKLESKGVTSGCITGGCHCFCLFQAQGAGTYMALGKRSVRLHGVPHKCFRWHPTGPVGVL